MRTIYRLTGAAIAVTGLTACSSSLRGPGVATEPRHDVQIVTAQTAMQPYERADFERAAADDGDRTASAAETRSPTWTNSGSAAWTDRTTPATADIGTMGSAAQRARVTLVAMEEPPLGRAETPSHEPRDGEFWVAGTWRGETGQFVWQHGRIERERTGELYVPANWVAAPQGWEFTPEYWR